MKHSEGWRSPLLAVLGVLVTLWLLPPVIHKGLRLCPVRPDGLSQAEAMPNWARKYGVNCSMCHTTVPRLTRAGYLFRRAGFRMPDEYGQEAKFNGLRDVYAARVREEFRGTRVTGGTSPSNLTTAFAFHELTFYPISGAFGQWWGTETELTFSPSEAVEVENAYLRATYPHQDWLFTARAGIFHPFEGYGASDRPVSNIRPLFQTTPAKDGSFDTLVKLWGQDQEGAEVGATWKDTTLTLAVLNGFSPAKGAANEGNDKKRYDYLLFFNQFLGDRAGLSAEYLNGNTGFKFDGTAGNEWINNYWRTAVYGNYLVWGEKLNVLAGFGTGKDHFPVLGTADVSGTFSHNGWFTEFESKLHEHFTGAVRYDTFRPSRSGADNRLSAVTVTGVIPFEHIKFLMDYQRKTTEKAQPTANQINHTVRLEWMAIF